MEVIINDICTNAVLNDIDSELVAFWRVVKEKPVQLMTVINEFILEVKGYSNPKNIINNLRGKIVDDITSSAFLYILKKVSRGTLPNKLVSTRVARIDVSEDIFLNTSFYLQNVEIYNTDYSSLKEYDTPNAIWYFDPPYAEYNNASFYSACKTNSFDHEKLRDFCKSLNCRFILSHSPSDYICELYKDFQIETIYTYNKLACDYRPELVISNYKLDLEGYLQPKSIRDDDTEEELCYLGDSNKSALNGYEYLFE